MSAKGRPERELLPLGGTAHSAKGAPMSPPGRAKGEYRSAQHEGAPITGAGTTTMSQRDRARGS